MSNEIINEEIVENANTDTPEQVTQIDSVENTNEKEEKCKGASTVAAFAISFFFCIFAPLEFYFSNISDVWYDIYNILPIIIVAFITMIVLLLGIGRLLSKNEKAELTYSFALMILAICSYVQGTFILVPYGEFNGEDIQWEKYTMYNASSIAVWVGIIALGVVAYLMLNKEKKNRVIRIVMSCLFAMQFISVIVVGINTGGFQYKERLRTVTENKWNYSKDKNYFIFIMDTMDSRVLADYMQQGMEDAVDLTFEDFIFYRDTMGAFNLTDYALTQIMTGEYFIGDKSYQSYIEEAYSKSPLLKKLDDEGWITRLHTGQSMPEGEGRSYIDNLEHVRLGVDSYPKLTRAIYNLVLFKYVPTPIKQYVYYEAERLGLLSKVIRIEDTDLDEYEQYTWDSGVDDWNNNAFFWNLNRIKVSEEEKVFNMYHLKGIHALRDLDGNMQVIEDTEETYSLAGETGVVLYMLYAWIEQIKAEGIYDDSVIVILGDHGAAAYADPQNFTQCPLLLIKGTGENHDFQVSDIPVSYDDLQDIFLSLLDGYTGTDVMRQALESDGIDVDSYELYNSRELSKRFVKLEETDAEVGRRRKMIFHKFTGDLVGNGKGGAGYELYTDYPSYDGSKIQSTGVIYEP